jgi:hypothetical protein
MILKP